MCKMGGVLSKLAQLSCITDGGLGAKLQAAGRFFVIFWKNYRYFNQRWSRGHKARGQGQGQGHKKNPRPRPRRRTKDTSASALQKKKGLHKNFLSDLQKKQKKSLHKNSSSDIHKKTFSKKIFKRFTKF